MTKGLTCFPLRHEPVGSVLSMLMVFQMLVMIRCASMSSSSDFFGAHGERAQVKAIVAQHDHRGMYPQDQGYIGLTGTFSPLGTTNPAEGELLQMHPVGLCDVGRGADRSKVQYGWIGFLRPEPVPHLPTKCSSVYQMAKYAMARGAIALLVDIDGVMGAQEELGSANPLSAPSLKHPLIILHPGESRRLVKYLRSARGVHARIKAVQPLEGQQEVIMFLTCFLFVGLVCVAIVIKVRCRRRNKRNNLAEQAKKALSRMECRRYKDRKCDRKLRVKVKVKKIGKKLVLEDCRDAKNNKNTDDKIDDDVDDDEDSQEITMLSDSAEVCVICLEGYTQNQELRVLPCNHEFHRLCVDPWLVQHRTCPLCNYNIVEGCYGTPPPPNGAPVHNHNSTLVYTTSGHPAQEPRGNPSCGHPSCTLNTWVLGYTQIFPQCMNLPPRLAAVPGGAASSPTHSSTQGGSASKSSQGRGYRDADFWSSHINSPSRQPSSTSHTQTVPSPHSYRGFGGTAYASGYLGYPNASTGGCGFGCAVGCGHDAPPPQSCLLYPPKNSEPSSTWIDAASYLSPHTHGSSSEETDNNILKVEVQHHAMNADPQEVVAPKPNTFQRARPMPGTCSDRAQLEPFLAALAALKAAQRHSSSEESSASLSSMSCEVRPPSQARDSLNSLESIPTFGLDNGAPACQCRQLDASSSDTSSPEASTGFGQFFDELQAASKLAQPTNQEQALIPPIEMLVRNNKEPATQTPQ